MVPVALVISSALGGLAGILFGVALGDISPYIGRDNVEVRGLAVIFLGGMGSIPRAVFGGCPLWLCVGPPPFSRRPALCYTPARGGPAPPFFLAGLWAH